MIEKQLVEDRTIYLIIKSRKNYLSDKLLSIHTTEESATKAMPTAKKKLFVRPISIHPAAISHCLISVPTLKEIGLDYIKRYQRLLSFNDFINK